MEKGISVIIPVYNAEDFLKKCLQSLLKQSFKDLEIICYPISNETLNFTINNGIIREKYTSKGYYDRKGFYECSYS